jgi:hypothetical protein
MVVVDNEIDETKMQANRQQFRWLWRCSGTTWGTSSNEAHPGLYSKPLDAAIGRVPPRNLLKQHKTLTKHNF